jgi:hypothetical protein
MRVAVSPGATALTIMPCSPRALAMLRVRASIPAFELE